MMTTTTMTSTRVRPRECLDALFFAFVARLEPDGTEKLLPAFLSTKYFTAVHHRCLVQVSHATDSLAAWT